MKWYRKIMIITWMIMICSFILYWLVLLADNNRAWQGLKIFFQAAYGISFLTLPVHALATSATLSKFPKDRWNWIFFFTYIPAALWLFYYSRHPDHFGFWGSIID